MRIWFSVSLEYSEPCCSPWPKRRGKERGGGEEWRLDTLMWKGGSGLEVLSRPSQPHLDVVMCVWSCQGGGCLWKWDSECKICGRSWPCITMYECVAEQNVIFLRLTRHACLVNMDGFVCSFKRSCDVDIITCVRHVYVYASLPECRGWTRIRPRVTNTCRCKSVSTHTPCMTALRYDKWKQTCTAPLALLSHPPAMTHSKEGDSLHLFE